MIKQKKRLRKREYMLMILFAIIFICSVQLIFAADEYKPYLHKPSTGDAPKLETFGEFKVDLFPGAGVYTYTIEVPPGVRGLQPLLIFTYSSQNMIQRPGIFGSGWSLTDNYIIRHSNYTFNNTKDDYFILSLENNNFKLFYNGSKWNNEINPNSIKIENLSNVKQYWLVTQKDGTKYRFGFNNDSELVSNLYSYTVRWSLDLINDTHGNTILYSYRENPFAEDSGAVYLSNITYNNDKIRLITFTYENQSRLDRRLAYEHGNLIEESRRLKEISIFFNSSLVRRYSLGYKNLNNEKSLSTLANISYIGSDNSSILNIIKLEYFDALKGFDNTTHLWEVPSGFEFSSNDLAGKDFGIRLIDVNNDGFPDLIKAKAGSHSTKLNNKINGWNDSLSFTIPSHMDIVNSNNIDQGLRFDDVNSDGLIDILKGKEGTGREIYLNNGTGWYNATINWSLPLNFINSSSGDLGVNLLDLNSDGKVDIVRAQNTIKEVYLNNGTGWSNNSDWNMPDFFVTSSGEDNGLRIVDLNNDGLPDLIKGGEPGSAWFNNGSGWVNHSEYGPNLSFVDYAGSRPDLGVRFMELNGDGLIDIVQNFLSNISYLNQTCIDNNGTAENCTLYNVTTATNTKLNNGSGWVAGIDWLSPEKFTDEGFNIGRRIADVNGDGYSDILVAYQGPPTEITTHIKNATSAYLLKRITNAYGGVNDISYNPSTNSDNGNNLGFNIWIIRNNSLNNSIGQEFGAGSLYSYLYVQGKFDYLTKEFRGFGHVNETNPDNSIITHFFHQDSILKGREFKREVYNSSGKILRANFNLYTNSSDGMIYLNETSIQIYDGENIPITHNVTFEYDFFGNILKINDFGDKDVNGDEKYEVFSYYYNTSNFIVDALSNNTLFAADNTSIIRRTFYFYDNQTSGVRIGDLTKIKRYNNDQDPETQYTYDSFGNIISQIEPLGHTTTYTYDSTGTYRVSEINALDHSINFEYDFGTGNLLSEKRHGLNRSYEYDTFGRIKKEIISPDTTNFPTKNYSYNFDGIAPEIIKIETKNNDSDYMQDIFIYDGFGNVIQTKKLFDNNIQIVKNYFYDNKYRIKEEQNPYLDIYSSNLSTPLNGSKIKYTYDSLDRVINITKQNNESIIVSYNKTIVSQFDENNNRIDYELDVYERI